MCITSPGHIGVPHKGSIGKAKNKDQYKRKDGFYILLESNGGEDINTFIISTLKIQYIGCTPIRIREV